MTQNSDRASGLSPSGHTDSLISFVQSVLKSSGAPPLQSWQANLCRAMATGEMSTLVVRIGRRW